MKVARVGTAAEALHPGEADPEVVSEASAPAVDSAVVAAPALRDWRIHLAAGVVAVLALVAALYLARGFFVPLLIGILASYALHPLVDWLEACRVPRSVGAALVLAVLVGSSSWVAFSLSDDAAAVIEKLPEAARKLRQNLSTARTERPDGAAEHAGSRPRTRGGCCRCGRAVRSRRQARNKRGNAREAGSARGRGPGARAHLAARLHARAVRVARHGCRAGPDRAAADLFPARIRRALPAQAGAARRAVAVAQEGRRAHPR